MKLIVTSQLDPAGVNMYNLFASEFDFVLDGEFDGKPKYKKGDYVLIAAKKMVQELEYLCDHFKPEIYIVGSRHQSSQKVKSLTCHSPGNWSKADFGGSPNEIAVAPALYLHAVLQELNKFADESFLKCYEVTHHGPSKMNAPIMFAEVGGSPEEWQNIDACRHVCKSMLVEPVLHKADVATGFGGTHYAPSFSKLTDIAIGHICPKYSLDVVDEKMILTAFENTVPKPNLAVIDWKGCNSSQREKLIYVFEKHKIVWKKTKDIE
jgi:D-aminoacyl-tRNA deacylase